MPYQVSREFRVLRALGGIGESVPVPRVYHLFEAANYEVDPSGVGTDFYLMEFVDGDIFDDPALLSVRTSNLIRISWIVLVYLL